MLGRAVEKLRKGVGRIDERKGRWEVVRRLGVMVGGVPFVSFFFVSFLWVS